MAQLDFWVMAVFALLIFTIGVTFTRVGSKSSQAFFEAGGETPWWINGLSLFISYFSAGTFVVWGSIAYKHGLVANTIQLTMAISGLLTAHFIAERWKRTGTRTAAEYIGLRFGTTAQQFYTYLILLLSLVNTSAVLYPVGKMVYVATPFSLNACIIAIGITIVLYTAAGGLWAVLVTDVVQFVVLTAAVLIVIPAAFGEVGGVNNFLSGTPKDFFEPFSQDYTAGFMLAFIGYQTVYIGGNWSYVQRYTSTSSERNAKKVAYLFSLLYLVSPIIWMLPPMVYRVINPSLQGLEAEGAYMMLCQQVLPAGLIGLVLSGMISATSSKANTTVNLAAVVFANDVYKKVISKNASDKTLVLIARLFTLVFGAGTIAVAMLVPYVGGIVNVVLSIAAVAGGALFAPIIWSLFSKRQTSFSVMTTTLCALGINLFFKVLGPSLLGLSLSRTAETIMGVGLPLLVLGLFELYYRSRNQYSPEALALERRQAEHHETTHHNHDHREAQRQNAFGVRVIVLASAAVGLGILVLGFLSERGSVTSVVGGIILAFSLFGLWRLREKSPSTQPLAEPREVKQ
ncbi:Na+:solute symporter [Fulvivirgaceae bacterium PWU4]|uniref:Na+:solute symporter n=1 Tax=Chryseosolibacter histidini TaxID=2782349 RepID=A0AAP2DJ68_9BACT|nr:sodium:solute symporter family protein [Chryseosolibacter histidini]MBT1696373.1 Na+:solute symporter [Chryseosolibacter histidini]